MEEVTKWLIEISMYSTLIPVCIGLAVLHQSERPIFFITLFTCIALLSDIIQSFYWITSSNNTIILHAYTVCQIIIVYLFFNALHFNQKKIKIFWRWVYFVFAALAFALLLFARGEMIWDTHSISISGLLIVFSSLMYLIDFSLFSIITESFESSYIILVSTLLIYHVVFTVIMSGYNIATEANAHYTIWNLKCITYTLFNIVIAYSIYKRHSYLRTIYHY